MGIFVWTNSDIKQILTELVYLREIEEKEFRVLISFTL